jgi:hypothetical protein
MTEYRQLQLTDLQISACQRWQTPEGTQLFELPHILPFFQGFAANLPLVTDVELGTPPEFDFVVKAIGNTSQTPGTLVQVQWPDGRYLSSAGVDVYSFWQTGKRGRLLDRPKRMPPSSKIRLSVDNSAVGSISNQELYFEGVLLVPMILTKGANGRDCILG